MPERAANSPQCRRNWTQSVSGGCGKPPISKAGIEHFKRQVLRSVQRPHAVGRRGTMVPVSSIVPLMVPVQPRCALTPTETAEADGRRT